MIGVGRLLRVYDLGKKKLLRKCENKVSDTRLCVDFGNDALLFQHIPNYVTSIQAIGHRIIVCDVQESAHWVRYRRNENQLVVFADDTYPRWVTSAAVLDWNTAAVADKFGNIAVVGWRS